MALEQEIKDISDYIKKQTTIVEILYGHYINRKDCCEQIDINIEVCKQHGVDPNSMEGQLLALIHKLTPKKVRKKCMVCEGDMVIPEDQPGIHNTCMEQIEAFSLKKK